MQEPKILSYFPRDVYTQNKLGNFSKFYEMYTANEHCHRLSHKSQLYKHAGVHNNTFWQYLWYAIPLKYPEIVLVNSQPLTLMTDDLARLLPSPSFWIWNWELEIATKSLTIVITNDYVSVDILWIDAVIMSEHDMTIVACDLCNNDRMFFSKVFFLVWVLQHLSNVPRRHLDY